jgi:hypothetical protein
MYELTIPGISGGPDQNAILSAILALDGNASVDFNWVTHKVSVKSSADLADIREMIAAIGYQIEKMSQREDSNPGHRCDLC